MSHSNNLHPITQCPQSLSHVEWLGQKEAQEKYGPNTMATQRHIAGAFKVSDHKDIPKILQWAFEADASLQAISSGKNWGYGSALPTSDTIPIYILDLSGLKSILKIDTDLGIVTLQAGVTQHDLSEFLRSNNYDFMVPVTGAGPHCSIVGNAIERGYGITPYTDHFGAVTQLKAYLPNGKHYSSSLDVLDHSEDKLVDHSFKWKLGPYLDGLFTQSNFGIVYEMTIRLAQRPKAFESFYIQFSHDSDLELALELTKKILHDYEGILGAINILDRRRILSMVAQNPNSKDLHQNMSDDQISQLGRAYKIPAWLMVGSIYGTKAVVKAVRKDIKNRVTKHCHRILFSNGLLLKFAEKMFKFLPARFLEKPRAQLEGMKEGIEIMLGIPNQVALPLAYWRNPRINPNKKESVLNPGSDSCGLMWYAPLVVSKSQNIRSFVNFVRQVCPKYNIEPLITLTNLRHDLTDSTIPILFNANDPQAVQDAQACLDELVGSGLKHGYVPYRMNIDQQLKLLDPEAPCWELAKSIKDIIDPKNILNPGRYQAMKLK